MDTRTAAVLSLQTGAFHADVARTLDVGGHWGVPGGAQAVTGNLTVTAQTGAGYVAIVADAAASGGRRPRPSTSRSATTGPTAWSRRSHGPSLGQTSLVYKAATGKTTQLILDLSGYFE